MKTKKALAGRFGALELFLLPFSFIALFAPALLFFSILQKRQSEYKSFKLLEKTQDLTIAEPREANPKTDMRNRKQKQRE